MNLPIQPPRGGIPASDPRKMVASVAKPGAYENKPPQLEISPLRVLREIAMITANIPRFVAAYTNMYTTTERNAEAETSDIPATANGMRTNPPWLMDEYAIMRTMLVWCSE